MTNKELLEAIREGRTDEEIVELVVDFTYGFDTYDCWDAFGMIEEEGVREAMKDNAYITLTEDPDQIIEALLYDIEEVEGVTEIHRY